jgi:hypothetical protein
MNMSKLAIPKLKSLLWFFSILLTAALYWCCFYMLRSPFACGQNELIDCREYWPNHMKLQALMHLMMFGAPGVLSVVLIGRKIVALAVWISMFSAWTLWIYAIYRKGLGLDGQNGCDFCDFVMLFMAALSYYSFFIAITIFLIYWFVVRREINNKKKILGV